MPSQVKDPTQGVNVYPVVDSVLWPVMALRSVKGRTRELDYIFIVAAFPIAIFYLKSMSAVKFHLGRPLHHCLLWVMAINYRS